MGRSHEGGISGAGSERRDGRLLFRDGWMLVLFMICFGAAAAGIFWWSAPRGAAGWIRFGVALGTVLLAGGIVAPIVTRALYRRR
jgi:hypothetical protein